MARTVAAAVKRAGRVRPVDWGRHRTQTRLDLSPRRYSRKVFDLRVGSFQDFLKADLRRGALGDKGLFQVGDDPAHHSVICKEGDDLHPPAQFPLCLFCPPFPHQTMQTMQTVGTVHNI